MNNKVNNDTNIYIKEIKKNKKKIWNDKIWDGCETIDIGETFEHSGSFLFDLKEWAAFMFDLRVALIFNLKEWAALMHVLYIAKKASEKCKGLCSVNLFIRALNQCFHIVRRFNWDDHFSYEQCIRHIAPQRANHFLLRMCMLVYKSKESTWDHR